MKTGIVVLTFTALLASLSAQAAEEDSCRNGFFPGYQGDYHQAVIHSDAGKVHFYDDMDGCPEKGASCASKAYLVPGDRVLVAQNKPGWSCVWYFAKKRDFTGWVPAAALTAIPTQPAQPESWLGRWLPVGGTDEITLVRKGNKLHVNGDAEWHGGKTDSGDEIIHVGSIDEDATVTGNRLIFGTPDSTSYECGGEMLLINDYLVVRDNSNCGGMNVRFNDVYRKKATVK